MTDTLSNLDGLAAYPMPRAQGCPFDPPADLGRRRTEEPISRVRIWDGSTPWLVTRYEHQRAVLADQRFSANPDHPGYPYTTPSVKARRQGNPTFISMDNPEHDRYRRMFTRDFMIKRVEALRPHIQSIVDGLIDDMVAQGPTADLVEALALPVPSLVICELLGVPYADHEFFQQRTRLLVARDGDPAATITASGELVEYLAELIRRKDADPADDLLSRLVLDQVRPGNITVKQAADAALLLLVAGHETTANMIALGTLALLRNPDQLAIVRDTEDPKVIANAVEEMLRYLTIVHSGRRRVALADVEVDGQLIRAGEGVILANDSGNRDPAAFPGDPDRLDVLRDARHHVAFGYGIHQCLGQPLARVELQVVYGTLYRRLPKLALAVPFEEVAFKHDMVVYGVHALPVTW
jgi:cytochrome P450